MTLSPEAQAEHDRLAAEYDNDPVYIYIGEPHGKCTRCPNRGPLYAMENDAMILCAECAWEFGWTEGGPNAYSYERGAP